VRVALGGHPDVVISSSLIRHLLSSGTVDGAALCLGSPYELAGTVIRGAGRGRSLGYPTVNLSTRGKLVPGEGVYAGRARQTGDTQEAEPIPAAISIGRNPTFPSAELTVEAYLLDFSGDLYDRELSLEFLQWLRPQERFASPNELIEQIRRDV